jgi:hypothetical protein
MNTSVSTVARSLATPSTQRLYPGSMTVNP